MRSLVFPFGLITHVGRLQTGSFGFRELVFERSELLAEILGSTPQGVLVLRGAGRRFDTRGEPPGCGIQHCSSLDNTLLRLLARFARTLGRPLSTFRFRPSRRLGIPLHLKPTLFLARFSR